MRKGILYIAGVLIAFIALLFVLGSTYERDLTIPSGFAGRHLDVDGVSLRYVQTGQGPDVLLIHGSMGMAEDWEAVIPLLAKKYRVTAIDRAGNAFSGALPGRHTIAANARLIRRFAEILQLKDVVVVGHSYGGAIALKLATEDMLPVRGYVLLAPAAIASHEVPLLNRAMALPAIGLGLARVLEPLGTRRMVEKGLKLAVAPDDVAVPPDFYDKRVVLWSNPGTVAVFAQQSAAFNEEVAAMGSMYRAIRKPVIIVQGDRDVFARLVGEARTLAQQLPHASLVELKQTGHYLQYRHPEAVSAAIDKVHTLAK